MLEKQIDKYICKSSHERREKEKWIAKERKTGKITSYMGQIKIVHSNEEVKHYLKALFRGQVENKEKQIPSDRTCNV